MSEPIFPQRPTEVNAEVVSVEWFFEPAWPGDRLIAHCRRGAVTVTDEVANPVGPDLAEVGDVLATAVLADQAVIDGIWTAQPFIGDGSLARAWAETLASEGLSEEIPDPLAAERRRALVVVDLLELDDEPLHDVPLQERRRLLESVIDPGVQVRLSPIVKHPLAGWLEGWRANGFSHYFAKHVNSRYVPGERSEDWLKIPLSGPPQRGMVGRLVGFGRGPRSRRIRD
jgi:bifunctional non-homologous end joining protein LigD